MQIHPMQLTYDHPTRVCEQAYASRTLHTQKHTLRHTHARPHTSVLQEREGDVRHDDFTGAEAVRHHLRPHHSGLPVSARAT